MCRRCLLSRRYRCAIRAAENKAHHVDIPDRFWGRAGLTVKDYSHMYVYVTGGHTETYLPSNFVEEAGEKALDLIPMFMPRGRFYIREMAPT